MEGATNPLLPHHSEPLSGVTDYRGRPVYRPTSGGWKAASFLFVLEMAERFSYYGVLANLISYLTGPLGESNAAAAAAVNAWSGTASLLPLLGAFIADSFLGRYRTYLSASLLYILGYGMLTLSATVPALRPSACSATPSNSTNCHASTGQIIFFYASLYLIAFGQGADKPCGIAFGADQFDPDDPKECQARSSLFNWWYFSMSIGISISVSVMSYLQDNYGWGLGFGVLCLIMISVASIFLLGTRSYRVYVPKGESPFIRVGRNFIILAKSSWGRHVQSVKTIESPMDDEESKEGIHQVEEARGVLRVLPIWLASLAYGIVFAQITTLFNKQGSNLDRRIGSHFEIPPAALMSFGTITILIFIPLYDRILVPVMRRLFKNPLGIPMLQRIGVGMVISLSTIVIAALVEMRRLKVAQDFGLVDQPNATVPMSWVWLVPQYVLIGVADVFALVGLQEFFYDQMPDALRSLGLAFYLSILGLGGFISSFLISVIDKVSRNWGDSWFSDNLNRAHLDYFYWLLAALSALELAVFFFVSRKYVYRNRSV